MTPAISLAGVARRFGTAGGGTISALEEFDLDIAPGEFCAIVGPTGCGKSTTLGLVAGLSRPQAGSVRLFGREVDGIDPRVGFVFQQDAVFPWRTVMGNVSAGPRFRGQSKSEAEARAAEWIARVGLRGFEKVYPHTLSGGMRKRVALAQTMVNGPEVVLMDEPFSALDVQTRELMQDELLALWTEQNRAAVLFVTHDLDEAILLADRVAVLTSAAGAGQVASIAIDLPRPSERWPSCATSPQFIEIARQLAQRPSGGSHESPRRTGRAMSVTQPEILLAGRDRRA